MWHLHLGMRIKLAEEVFGLIKGLSRTEKAYIKKRGFGKTESKLAIGFDIINSFDDFDETAITDKLQNQKVNPKEIYKRLLPVILSSLRQYHAGSTPEIELNEIIVAARLLIRRKQRTLGLREIERGIEIARSNEHYPSLVELNGLKQMALRISHQPTSEDDADNYSISLDAVKNLERSIHLDYLYRRISGILQEGFVTKKVRNELVQEILEHPALQEATKNSYRTYVLRLRIQAACYYFSGQWEEAIRTGITQLEGMPAFEDGSESNIRNRMVMLMDLANLYQLIYDHDNYLKTREEFEAGMVYNSAFFDLTAAKVKMGRSLADMNNALLSGHLNEAVMVGEGLLASTEPQLLVTVIKKRIMSAIALAYFYKEEYSKAIHYINTEYSISDSNALNDCVRWIELLCWFHLNDQSMFESRWLSWSRQLKKLDSGYEWEELVMKTLKQAYGKPKHELMSIMTELNQKLKQMELELRTALMGEFDFLVWTESLSLGRPMILLIKDMYRNHRPSLL